MMGPTAIDTALRSMLDEAGPGWTLRDLSEDGVSVSDMSGRESRLTLLYRASIYNDDAHTLSTGRGTSPGMAVQDAVRNFKRATGVKS